jgi:probable addiction module antidote protein
MSYGATDMKTERFDPMEVLTTSEEQQAYLNAAFEDGDPAVIAVALGHVARARGITALAQETGTTRAALYKSFSESGNPTLSTLTSVLKALGLKLSVATAG